MLKYGCRQGEERSSSVPGGTGSVYKPLHYDNIYLWVILHINSKLWFDKNELKTSSKNINIK